MSIEVRHNADESRYELYDDGTLAAIAAYTRHDDVADFTHTETLDGYEGRGLASQLVRGALDDVRSDGLHLRPSCPFVRRFVGEHHEYLDLMTDSDRARFGLD